MRRTVEKTNPVAAAVTTDLADGLRSIPWERRTQFIEFQILLSSLWMMENFPDITGREVVLSMFENYKFLAELLDDGEIDCLDHAALLISLVPSRASIAAKWLHKNVTDNVEEQWWKSHPRILAFNQLMIGGQSETVH